MMKIVVFGANGGTGSHVVEQALTAGHQVTAVVRRPETVKHQHSNLTVLKGDVLDPASVVQAIQGQEAVISTLGITNGSGHTVHSQGVGNMIRAMQNGGVRRLICLSASGLEPGPLWQRVIAKPMLWYFLGDHYTDLVKMEEAVKQSGLDWTILRPPRLTDGPHTKHYEMGINQHLAKCWSITRADLADCMVTHLQDPKFNCATVEVAN
jgi:putative NADH-flavin reductase